MAGPRNGKGVNDATDCYRTFNGARFDHWTSAPSEEEIAEYRASGVRCRRQGEELYVHVDDMQTAARVSARMAKAPK